MILLVLVVLPLAVHGDDVSSKNSFTEVQASEILAKVQNGEPVEYDHIIIKGDINISQLNLPIKQINRTSFDLVFGYSESLKVVSSSIRINDSTFDGFVSINYTILDESIDFSGSDFTKGTYFEGSVFNDNANFEDSEFNGTATFEGSIFSDDA
jgi:hypothetical protein